MRIALCLEYPIDQHGGTEVLVSEMVKRLSKQHQIILVSPDGAATLSRSPVGSLITEHISFSLPWTVSKAKMLAEKVALAKPDLAHFHFGGVYGWGNRFIFQCPLYYLHRRKVACFSTVHLVVSILEGFCGPQKPLWFKLLLFPLAWISKLLQLGSVCREVAVSKHDFEKLRRWYWPFRNRFAQIYHSRLPEKTPARIQNSTPIILNVGHLAWRKGQAVLAEAFAAIAPRHPEWILQLAGSCGDPVVAARIGRIIEDHQLQGRILLLGARSDALELMQQAAIYVQPSFWEALGLSLQEAMFSGCACIGSRAGGIPELIHHEQTGLLFEPGSVGQLANALEKLVGNQPYREQLGRAAIASIQERGMTAGQMVKHYLELYEAASRR